MFNYTDHLGNIRLSYAKDPLNIAAVVIMEENHYYPFGLKHTKYNSDTYDFVVTDTETGDGYYVWIDPVAAGSRKLYQYKYQGQERQDELGLNWDSFKWRNYDYAIGRFMSIDPLAEDYTYNSPYAFAENKLGMGRELEGCELGPLWNPLVGVMLSETSKPAIVENTMLKPAVETSVETSKFSESTLENFSRGRATEVEQLAENNLEKNTESFTRIDPKTGKEGTTIPDAMTPEGATVEVKNVQKQSLTRQLRLQREISNENGVKPELIINKDAKLSEPLQNGGFDIKTYEAITPVIESTGVAKPDLPRRVNTPSTTTPKPKVIVVRQSS